MTTPNQSQETPPDGGADEGAQLKAQLEQLRAQLSQKDQQLRSATDRAERVEHVLRVRQATQTQQAPGRRLPAGRVQPQPPEQSEEPNQGGDDTAVAQVLADNDKELMLLREVVRRGLSLEEAQGIDFTGPDDLKIKLDLLQQKQEIATLRGQLTQAQEDEPPGVTVDTGGPSGSEAGTLVPEESQRFRETARNLRGERRYQEATWQALRGAHADPSKRLRVRSDE